MNTYLFFIGLLVSLPSLGQKSMYSFIHRKEYSTDVVTCPNGYSQVKIHYLIPKQKPVLIDEVYFEDRLPAIDTTYDINGNIQSVSKYYFNDKGTLQEVKIRFWKDAVRIHTIKADDAGFIRQYRISNDTALIMKAACKYSHGMLKSTRFEIHFGIMYHFIRVDNHELLGRQMMENFTTVWKEYTYYQQGAEEPSVKDEGETIFRHIQKMQGAHILSKKIYYLGKIVAWQEYSYDYFGLLNAITFKDALGNNLYQHIYTYYR